MKKLLIPAVLLLIAIGAGIYFYARKPAQVSYKTQKVERGSIVSTVSATGTINAVVTVQVGTQVSGTLAKLYVDYNSPVKKGQAIAQIDPSLFNAQLEQSRGNYLNAEANVAKAKVSVADTRRTLDRNTRLLKEGIVAQADFDAAQTAYDAALAGLKSAEAAVIQTKGALSQAETNLKYATIRSPVDGIVVSRSVDVGQTVAASFQTPTLFTIAQDLTKMQIETSVDESDISKIKVGQTANFTVDAYPERPFTGTVKQIRNAPVTAQNVVTYVVVIGVDNRELLLKPGMTANVSIQINRRDDVLKIPNAALRFKPKGGKASREGTKPGMAAKGEGAKGSGPGPMKKEKAQKVYILGPDGKPVPVEVRTGIADDRFVELVEGNLKENEEVITDQPLQEKKNSGMGAHGPRF